jgi:chorismate-pyruvate lyase
MEAKMEIVRRRKEIRRRQGQGDQTTINLRYVLLGNNASVVATTTSESHRRDAHGRGFQRKRSSERVIFQVWP